jgi:DNA-binding SARP family transcriptional activator/Tfp pilus assembly protein PilF
MLVEFRLLGAIEAYADGRAIDVGHARQRCVLAALLTDVNRVVPTEQLLDRVWADQWPQRARTTLSSYLSRLRQVLAGVPGIDLKRQSGGYQLTGDPLSIDIHRFRHEVAQARSTDDPAAAAEIFEQALRLWRGTAFESLDTPWINSVRQSLEAERLAAELDRNDIALALGRHAAVLADLAYGTDAHPLDERLAGQFMLALYRCERQADALQHYERLRRQLTEELGTDPSASVQVLHKQILTGDPALMWSKSPRPARLVPRQLPAPPRAFSGRTEELTRLDGLLSTINEGPQGVVIAAISGSPGVGKTALALHWAHQVAGRFQDGQLYVNLRGFDPERHVMNPAEAVRGFLDALDVLPQRLPSSLDGQVALYRSLVADRRMLVVLDNARDAEQVRPLLPGAPGCLVLVTSRNRLIGLLAGEGAFPLVLGLLSADEAGELLARHVGADRIAAEPDAVDEIIARCSALPLALSIVSARAATRSGFALATLARELQDAHNALDAFADEDPAMDVRAVFSLSYQALGDAAARLFRLLGLPPGPDIGVHAAASLAAIPVAQARRLLAELARAHLVAEHIPGRYTLHDLLRAYATEQAKIHDGDAELSAAIRRWLAHYLHSAFAAAMLVEAARDPISLPPAETGAAPEHPRDIDDAFAWFAAEHQVLLTAIRWAADIALDAYAWRLAWTLTTYLNRRGRWYDWVDSHETALAATQRLGDQPALAYVHRSLARAYARLGRDDDALRHFHEALDLLGALDDLAGKARTHIALSWLHDRLGQYALALEHDECALSLYREVGHQIGIANSLNNAGWHQAHLGHPAEALTACQQSLVLHREAESRHGEADALESIGFIYHRQGMYRLAVEHYRQALVVQRELGSRVTEAGTLVRLGDAHEASGDAHAATESWQHALSILEELQHPDARQVRAKLGAGFRDR